jgi:polysaccharide biosynthesis/export protein
VMSRRFLAIVAVIAASAQVAAVTPDPSDECSAAYVIGPDDVLDVSVWGNAEVSRTVPVRPDGRISLPLLNDIEAAGLTPMQLREKVESALKPYMPEPSVSVLVREIRSVKVTIIGDVKTPGRYEIKDRATVLDVLAMAGGLTEFADRDAIVVLRQDAGRTRQLRFDYARLVSRHGNGANGSAVSTFCVKAGDVVVVP